MTKQVVRSEWRRGQDRRVWDGWKVGKAGSMEELDWARRCRNHGRREAVQGQCGGVSGCTKPHFRGLSDETALVIEIFDLFFFPKFHQRSWRSVRTSTRKNGPRLARARHRAPLRRRTQGSQTCEIQDQVAQASPQGSVPLPQEIPNTSVNIPGRVSAAPPKRRG